MVMIAAAGIVVIVFIIGEFSLWLLLQQLSLSCTQYLHVIIEKMGEVKAYRESKRAM
jgi:hypothetical protein